MKEIVNYLTNKGFKQASENVYETTRKMLSGTVIVNGVEQKQYQEANLKFTYIGDSYIENVDGSHREEATQWDFSVNGYSQGEFIIHDVNEFAQTFKL